MNSMLEYKGYHASVEYDAEDNIFVGEVFGITDSLNFHGTSVTELKEMFEQCIDNYLELCEKIGKNPDKKSLKEHLILEYRQKCIKKRHWRLLSRR